MTGGRATNIVMKLYDVLSSPPWDAPAVMIAFYAPSEEPPRAPRASIRGETVFLQRRPGEVLGFRLKPEAAKRAAAAGYVLFSEVGGNPADYPVPLETKDKPAAPRTLRRKAPPAARQRRATGP